MKWKNIGLVDWKNKDAENFTTDAGIVIRRKINPIVKGLIKLATKQTVILDGYPALDKNETYIFASGHFFPDEVNSNLMSIDRNVYLLAGTTDQIDTNPKMYIAWLNGLIYVNKLDPVSRKDSVEKMVRILNSGTSVLMFPEGVLNNTENLYCGLLYPGIYYLAQRTNKKIVPMASQTEYGSDKVYTKVGDPIDFTGKSKKEALIELRDAIATIRYELMEHYPPLIRETLEGDQHLKNMEDRKKIYDQVNWTKEVWDEEITPYISKEYTTPEVVRESFDDVIITPHNAHIIAPFLVSREEDKKYDFKRYMKKNWNK